jgi:DNA-binding transcriptional LysR family regulator
MELRHLRYFVAVAEALNYRQASERLHVAQPTLSSQIQDLEHELGVRLLDRNTRGVRLTAAGSIFLQEVRLTLTQFQHAIAMARETIPGRRGRLVVGYIAVFLGRFMPSSVKAFYKKFPDTEVVIVDIPLGKQILSIKSGSAQIGFMLRRRSDPPCPLPHLTITQSPINVAFAKSHRLAKLRAVALTDLAQERLVCLAPDNDSPWDHGTFMRRVFSDRGLKFPSITEINGPDAVRATLESGSAVSLVVAFGSFSQSRVLVVRPLADTGDDLVVELVALWRDQPASGIISNFLACMRSVALRETRPGKRRRISDPRALDGMHRK